MYAIITSANLGLRAMCVGRRLGWLAYDVSWTGSTAPLRDIKFAAVYDAPLERFTILYDADALMASRSKGH